jgi:hypothetical protein
MPGTVGNIADALAGLFPEMPVPQLAVLSLPPLGSDRPKPLINPAHPRKSMWETTPPNREGPAARHRH